MDRAVDLLLVCILDDLQLCRASDLLLAFSILDDLLLCCASDSWWLTSRWWDRFNWSSPSRLWTGLGVLVGLLLRVLVSADLCLRERPVPSMGGLFFAADGLKEPLMGLVLLLDRRGGAESALGLTDLRGMAIYFDFEGWSV